ncbi:glycosyltransferase [Vibrio sp. SG41-7]|uniref:glycosyltransferase n=1 Tax=Vibrio sp. SG41-7 TaxID=2760973 RepID=UPI0016037DDF|nr:glycosyltransferase [Vibrio sp. SG41-7]MBB1464845.1 glycosyltransferase [Vibrio sp. SG41-7]
MKLAIFATKFPLISETFVINQAIELQALGNEVSILCESVDPSGFIHDSINNSDLKNKIIELKPTNDNMLTRQVYNLKNIAKMCVTNRYKELLSIVFDRNMTLNQKESLVNYLSKKDVDKLEFNSIICHFGTNGYLLTKLRELGYLSGSIYVYFHGYELSRHAVLKKYTQQYRKLFSSAEKMLPVCEHYKNILINIGCPEEKIKVQKMGVNVEQFSFNRDKNINRDKLRLIQVGRLTEKKAIVDSIKAVINVSNQMDVEFNIIGDGELRSDALKLIEEYDASNYIKLLGSMSQDNVNKMMDYSDILLLPSVTPSSGDTESIPVCLMEALSKGLLVISTNHSGIPELILNNKTGFTVEESDVDALSEKILLISRLNDKEIISYRERGRKACLENHDNIKLNRELFEFIGLNDVKTI